MEVGWDEVRARRLARSSLIERASGDRLVEVVGDLCGVHAQVQAAAELQLAARVDGIAQADVRAALWEQRSLVKAWTLRGTLHLHPAAELPLWHAARRAVLRSADQGLPAWRDPAGDVHPALGAREVEGVRATVWEVLDGRCLLREELAEAVVKRVGASGARASPLGLRVLPRRSLPGTAAGRANHARAARPVDRGLAGGGPRRCPARGVPPVPAYLRPEPARRALPVARFACVQGSRRAASVREPRRGARRGRRRGSPVLRPRRRPLVPGAEPVRCGCCPSTTST